MIALWLAACAAPELVWVTSELPEAHIGEVYSAAIEVEGGAPPLMYSASGLPPTLAMNPAVGIISGVPDEEGTWDVAVTVTDVYETAVTETFTLAAQGARSDCGRTYQGVFDVAAEDFLDIDWEATRGWTTRTLAIPPDDIDRITFTPKGDADILIRIGKPGAGIEPGVVAQTQATPLEQFFGFGRPVALDWTTHPNLGAYQAVSADEATLLISAFTPGAWSIDVTCTPGPILNPTVQGPFPVGDRLRGSYRDTETNADVAIEVLDPLPQGAEISERGTLTGTAEVSGNHIFRLRATRPDGAETVTPVELNVYEPLVMQCGESREFETTRASESFVDASPEAFAVAEADWDGSAALFWTVEFDEEGRAELADPNAALVRLTEPPETFDGELVEIEQSPNRWPPPEFYQAWPQSRVVLSNLFGPASGTITLTCDEGSRPDFVAFPILTPGSAETLLLEAVGGEPPYTWAAEGLPASVTLETDGTLRTTGEDFGVVTVDVTVGDANGEGTRVSLPLYSSLQGACGPDAIILSCDDEGRFASGTYEEVPWPRFCIAPGSVEASDFIWYDFNTTDFSGRLSLLRFPELTEYDRLFGSDVLFRGLNRLTRGLEHHDGLPFVMEVGAFTDSPLDGGWDLCLSCGTGVLQNVEDCGA